MSSLGKCPACGKSCFKRHANYYKYYFNHRIQIMRVRCEGCNRTHAIIPSFSLPGTSLGTEETEQYLINRDKGLSRNKSMSKLFEHINDKKTGKRIEKMFNRGIENAKSLFASAINAEMNGISWINSLCGETETPILTLNLYCLSHGFNAVCFNRYNILDFHKKKTRMTFSLNNPSDTEPESKINSS